MEEDSKGESSMKALTRRGFIGMAATAGMATLAGCGSTSSSSSSSSSAATTEAATTSDGDLGLV